MTILSTVATTTRPRLCYKLPNWDIQHCHLAWLYWLGARAHDRRLLQRSLSPPPLVNVQHIQRPTTVLQTSSTPGLQHNLPHVPVKDGYNRPTSPTQFLHVRRPVVRPLSTCVQLPRLHHQQHSHLGRRSIVHSKRAQPARPFRTVSRSPISITYNPAADVLHAPHHRSYNVPSPTRAHCTCK